MARCRFHSPPCSRSRPSLGAHWRSLGAHSGVQRSLDDMASPPGRLSSQHTRTPACPSLTKLPHSSAHNICWQLGTILAPFRAIGWYQARHEPFSWPLRRPQPPLRSSPRTYSGFHHILSMTWVGTWRRVLLVPFLWRARPENSVTDNGRSSSRLPGPPSPHRTVIAAPTTLVSTRLRLLVTMGPLGLTILPS